MGRARGSRPHSREPLNIPHVLFLFFWQLVIFGAVVVLCKYLASFATMCGESYFGSTPVKAVLSHKAGVVPEVYSTTCMLNEALDARQV